MEYEEVVTRLSGTARWQQILSLFEVLGHLHGTILRVEPKLRFCVITVNPDDNKSVDGAIVAEANFVVTADRNFSALAEAGYRPQPIHPGDFVERDTAAELDLLDRRQRLLLLMSALCSESGNVALSVRSLSTLLGPAAASASG